MQRGADLDGENNAYGIISVPSACDNKLCWFELRLAHRVRRRNGRGDSRGIFYIFGEKT